jgi:hypothetical protein
LDRPAPDDGPEPYRTTPRRLSRQIRDRASECADLAIRLAELAACLKPGPIDDAIEALQGMASILSNHSIAVLFGKAEILPELCDGTHQPDRPLLDVIEARPLARVAEAIAPAVAARGDTDPVWEGMTDHHGDNSIVGASEPLRLPLDHPQAEPARAAARRRNGRKGGGS